MTIEIQEINNQYDSYKIQQEKQALQNVQTDKNVAAKKDAVVEKLKGKANQDSIEISHQGPNQEQLKEISAREVSDARADLRTNMSAFRAMAAALFKDQAMTTAGNADPLAEIAATSETARTDDEDPWGAKAVSERILNFAKALADGDDSKIDMLREAMEKGFKAAEDIWGGTLPDVCYETLELIRKGFDEWKNPPVTE